MSAIEAVEAALEASQVEKIAADVGLIEAQTRADAANDAAGRLLIAVAALRGEDTVAVEISKLEPLDDPPAQGHLLNKADYPPITPPEGNLPAIALPGDPAPPAAAITEGNHPTAIQSMTPQQFDAHRLKQQRAAKKAEIAANPLGHMKCPGCGSVGDMHDTITTAPSGATVRMMACSKCNNQILQ